jgi:cytochrome c-type biogenesis protein CcmH/NrfF
VRRKSGFVNQCAPRALLAGILLGCVLLAGSAIGETSTEAARRAQGLEDRVMSPFCPGKTIKACPSPKAGEWRNDIRQWATEGLSNDQIEHRLQERVPGFDLSGRPPEMLGGWLPLVLGLGAIGALFFVLRKTTGLGRSGATAPTAADKVRSDAGTDPGSAVPDVQSAADVALDRRINDELDAL